MCFMCIQGNLWFVLFIDCNVKHSHFTKHKFHPYNTCNVRMYLKSTGPLLISMSTGLVGWRRKRGGGEGVTRPPNFTHCLHNELHCSIVDRIACRHYSSRKSHFCCSKKCRPPSQSIFLRLCKALLTIHGILLCTCTLTVSFHSRLLHTSLFG